MAKRISLSSEIWSMSGYRSLGDFRRKRAELSGVWLHLPSSVEGALERAGHIPDYRLDERGCEWAANRLWAMAADFDMPAEPEGALSEKHFLHIQDIFGEGAVFLNEKEIFTFGLGENSLAADVTGDIIEAGRNRLEIVFFRCSSKAIENIQAAYEGLDAPFTAPRGICSDVYIKSTSYCRMEELQAYFAGEKVCARVKIDASNRGKYMFKYRLIREGQLVGTADIIENLLAKKQELGHEIAIDSQDACAVRLTVERGGVRCDFETVTVQKASLSAQKMPAKIRAAVWAPISPRLCDVSADEYEKAFSLLKSMGLNAVYIRRSLNESALFERICGESQMTLIREGDDGGLSANAAKICIPAEKNLPAAFQRARRSGKPLLISGIIAPFGQHDAPALFTRDFKPAAAYGHASQGLRPWMVYIEKDESGGIAGPELKIVSCCDGHSGQVVLAETTFWDYAGAHMATRAVSFIQNEDCSICGEIFPPKKGEQGEGLMAIDVKLYTKEGMVASCREIFCQRAQSRQGPMPRVQRLDGRLSVINDSPHYSREVMVIDGLSQAHMLALRPWEKVEVTA